MAAVIETLEILIEADRSGLESQLKRAGNTIVSFVSSMNKQEVNWQSILSRAISPAIIAGVASMFALAITQILGFNNALMKSAAGATDVFGENIGTMGAAARDLASGTTVSADDAAKGLALLSKSSFDSATQMMIASQSTKLAELRGLDYVATVQNMIDTMKAWNITTVPATVKAFDYLNSAQKNSAFTWDEFVKIVTDAGPKLRQVTTFADAVEGLAAFSMQAGFTKDTVTGVFQAITKAIDDPLNTLNYLNASGKMIGTLIDEEGIVSAFKSVADSIRNHSLPAAIVLGQQWGLNQEAVIELRNSGVNAFIEIKQREIDNIISMRKLNDEFQIGVSETDKLKTAWNNFKTAFTDPRLVTIVKDIISEILDLGTALTKALVHPMEAIKGVWAGAKELFKKPVEVTESRTVATQVAEQKRSVGSILSEVANQIPGVNLLLPKATKANQPTVTPSTTPATMGSGGGNIFNNTFFLTGSSDRQWAEGFVKQIQSLMHTQ